MQGGCQLRKPKKIGDRAPITPIVRPELPFEIVNIDVIGPIQPSSGRGHKYVLCTNFKSALTQEFTKGLDLVLGFPCPGYPASNGLVERWNMFAYREVPNTTTGVLPFRLLYGREARGLLAILKSSWAGEIHLPTNISQSAADYLQEMKINMEKAAENSSNKIYARWTGPGEIIQHHPTHSYKVKLSDGTVRHVHVNKIRKYHPRTLAVGVLFEGDHEFGEIHPTPDLSRSTSERVLHEINLKEKSLKIKVDEQIEELLRLDLIEESDAEIAYPIVCVNKKDGTLRLCVDFRALNSRVCLMIFRWKSLRSSYILLEEPISSQR
ncbi:retrovirus-related Pol polyprotein from transposon 17.6 [Trichonephila clavipes]|nr:retrovirus-related Pol polyprotein from transposon 17.6 [Trichonephila clavipes]